jgi:ADP-ribose pyrophosphatase YjhB (NUDIX family)
MNSHSGQISFPGGKADPSDTDLVHTALRETFEEVGVPLDRERVVGRLDDAWSVSRRLVYPYVAVSESEPSFTPNPAEVSRLLVGELSNLLEPDALQTRKLSFEGIEFIDQTYTVEGETVWGLTADILTEFLDWLRDSPEPGHRAHKREEELVAFLQRFPKDGSMDRGNS